MKSLLLLACVASAVSYEFIGKITLQEYGNNSVFLLFSNASVLTNESTCGVEFWRELNSPEDTYNTLYVADNNITSFIPNRINPACEKQLGYACMTFPVTVLEVNYFRALAPLIDEWKDTTKVSPVTYNKYPSLPNQITEEECDGGVIVKLIGRSMADPMFGYTAYSDFANRDLILQGKDALSSLTTSVINPTRLYPSQIPIPVKAPQNPIYRYRFNSDTAFQFQSDAPADANSFQCYKQTLPPNPSVYYGGNFNETDPFNASVLKGAVRPYDSQFDPYNTTSASSIGLNESLYLDWSEDMCDVKSGCIYLPYAKRGPSHTCFNFANDGGFKDGRNNELCESYVYKQPNACIEGRQCKLSSSENGACNCGPGSDSRYRTYTQQDCCSFLMHGTVENAADTKRQTQFEKDWNRYCGIHIPGDSNIDNPEYQSAYKYALQNNTGGDFDVIPSATLDASGVRDANYYYDTNEKKEQIPYTSEYSPCNCKNYDVVWTSVHFSSYDLPKSANKDVFLDLLNSVIGSFGVHKPSGIELRIQGYQWSSERNTNGVEPNLPAPGLYLPSDDDTFVSVARDWLGTSPKDMLTRVATGAGITDISEFVFQNYLNDDLGSCTHNSSYKEVYSIFPSSCIRWPYGRVHQDTITGFNYTADRSSLNQCPKSNRSHSIDLLYIEDKSLIGYCESMPGAPRGALPYCANDPLTLSQRQAFCNTTKAQVQVVGTVVNSRSEADACHVYNHSLALTGEPAGVSAICLVVQDVAGTGDTIDKLSKFLEDQFYVGHVDFVVAPFNVSLLEQIQPDAYLSNISQPDPLNPQPLLSRPLRRVKSDDAKEFFIYPTQFRALANMPSYASDYFARNGINTQGLLVNLSTIFQELYDDIRGYYPACTPHIPELQYYDIEAMGINPTSATARDASHAFQHSTNNEYCVPLNVPYKPSYTQIDLGPAVTVSLHPLIQSIPLRFAPTVTRITTSLPADTVRANSFIAASFSESISTSGDHAYIHGTVPQCWALNMIQTSLVNTTITLIQHPLCRGIAPYASAGIVINTPESPIFNTLIGSDQNSKLQRLRQLYPTTYDTLKITHLSATVRNLSPNPTLSVVGMEAMPLPLKLGITINSTADVVATMAQYNCTPGCFIGNTNNNNSQQIIVANFYSSTENTRAINTTLSVVNLTAVFGLLSPQELENLDPLEQTYDHFWIIVISVLSLLNLLVWSYYGVIVHHKEKVMDRLLHDAYPTIDTPDLKLNKKEKTLTVNGKEYPHVNIFNRHFRAMNHEIMRDLDKYKR